MVSEQCKIFGRRLLSSMVENEEMELPGRITNVELLKIVKEHDVERKLMRKEMEKLKEELRNRSSEHSEEVGQGSEEEPLE